MYILTASCFDQIIKDIITLEERPAFYCLKAVRVQIKRNGGGLIRA